MKGATREDTPLRVGAITADVIDTARGALVIGT